jgi:hypothetical protein
MGKSKNFFILVYLLLQTTEEIPAMKPTYQHKSIGQYLQITYSQVRNWPFHSVEHLADELCSSLGMLIGFSSSSSSFNPIGVADAKPRKKDKERKRSSSSDSSSSPSKKDKKHKGDDDSDDDEDNKDKKDKNKKDKKDKKDKGSLGTHPYTRM